MSMKITFYINVKKDSKRIKVLLKWFRINSMKLNPVKL